MSNSTTVKKLRFKHQDTRKNLPTAGKRGESNFLAKFERVFLESELLKKGPHKLAAGREFAVEGYGRADVLFLAWKESPECDDFRALALKSLKLTAFEAKLKDWRRGLQQASRYRYFSNRAILVLPTETARIAVAFLDTFRQLRVGLWEFDVGRNRVIRHYTPRAGKPRNTKARAKAIHELKKMLKLG